MSAFATKSDHKTGFLRSNGVEFSVFAMLAGLGVAMFLMLTILGGEAPISAVESEKPQQDWNERQTVTPDEPAASIGGAGSSEDQPLISE